MTTLRDEGWQGEFSGTCPVQGLGTVDGRPFYFRARGSEWSLSIAEIGKDPVGVPYDGDGGWHHEEEWPGDEFDASYMELTDVYGCMKKAVALFRTTPTEEASPKC